MKRSAVLPMKPYVQSAGFCPMRATSVNRRLRDYPEAPPAGAGYPPDSRHHPFESSTRQRSSYGIVSVS